MRENPRDWLRYRPSILSSRLFYVREKNWWVWAGVCEWNQPWVNLCRELPFSILYNSNDSCNFFWVDMYPKEIGFCGMGRDCAQIYVFDICTTRETSTFRQFEYHCTIIVSPSFDKDDFVFLLFKHKIVFVALPHTPVPPPIVPTPMAGCHGKCYEIGGCKRDIAANFHTTHIQ